MRPRAKDIAKLAYVSESTVSRVLNGRDGVSPDVRRRVMVAARTLGYTASPQGLIGLVIPDRTHYFMDLGLIFQDHLDSLELQVIIASTDGSEGRELELARQFIGIGLRGVVYIAASEPRAPVLEVFDQADMPVLVFDRRPDGDRHDAVCADGADGMRRIVDYLLVNGHRRIGYLGGLPGTPTASEREAGFRAAMDRHGLVVEPRWMWAGDYRAGSGLRCADHLLYCGDDLPSAVVCANDLMAIGLMHRLQDAGWTLPADLSVVGVDNIEAGRWSSPALTTVDQRVHELVGQAVLLLTDRLRERESAPERRMSGRHVMLKPVLIPRKSVAPLTSAASLPDRSHSQPPLKETSVT